MKNYFVIGLAVLGGIVLYKWYAAKTGNTSIVTSAAQLLNNASPSSPVSAPQDVPGVPEFNSTPVLNRPDQLFATMYSNPLSSVEGGPQYTPAFGPTENTGGTTTF